MILCTHRSSRPDVFCEKGVLRNTVKFTGKHLCQSLFFNKIAGIRPSSSLKKTLAQVFFCELFDISKITFFYRTLLVAASVHKVCQDEMSETTGGLQLRVKCGRVYVSDGVE